MPTAHGNALGPSGDFEGSRGSARRKTRRKTRRSEKEVRGGFPRIVGPAAAEGPKEGWPPFPNNAHPPRMSYLPGEHGRGEPARETAFVACWLPGGSGVGEGQGLVPEDEGPKLNKRGRPARALKQVSGPREEDDDGVMETGFVLLLRP